MGQFLSHLDGSDGVLILIAVNTMYPSQSASACTEERDEGGHDRLDPSSLAGGAAKKRADDVVPASKAGVRNGGLGAGSADPSHPTDAARGVGPLSPAACRALAEAQARREAAPKTLQPKELGRCGCDPARYGDWEVKGIAIDF